LIYQDIQQPLSRFILDFWKLKDHEAATLSCMQFLANSKSDDLVELWKSLPKDSLHP
jgi:spatacsin